MFLARKRIRISKEEGHAAGRAAERAELQPQLDAVKAENRELREQQAQRDAGGRAELQPQLDAALAAAAQATAQMEVMQAEKRLMQERQDLRDEEVRFLREQLARRENGGGNGNDE